MSSGHLKRLVAPRSWNIARKERTWTTKPMPGKHSLEGALPISTILRDYLKVCDNNREAKIILHNRDVFVDQRVVNKPKFPVGLMDVISIPKIKLHVRAMLDKHGRIEFVPIKAADSKWKLARVENKRNIKGGHTQINLHDGTNILSKEKVKTGDVLQLDLPDLKVKKVLKFKKGAQSLIIGGAHVGSISTIMGEETTRSTKPNLVMYENFQTIRPYSFVVGEKKAMISLPEVKV
ncbi:MAG: 30S ribosomal protein S4e [Candidatus Thermoplasmatota archaeon]|jgi:small subunit ribosomal protein S4e|nr:30S ribosomal protein S4e [Candidatus Thermoplasmatota archaeon]MEC7349480.1 30S ribosomal protein S4e [Candidatus Thermoplasmatota archaeon]MEC7416165.1 30S ribosomal protein S4e [Candidatus Thermoplasmatota archaeon]MEC7494153.1 30S ribosomal protein S4e [Candidatus Thermoplasmatota archaeon]MEC7697727.1 30S ribosomal protein S4e [Candidatus Thermoplasmatota archaeon]